MTYVLGIFRLAECYAHGLGTEQDDIQAANLYKKVAAYDDVQAMLALALLYKGSEVIHDPLASFEWVLKAAQAGNTIASNLVGTFYEEGFGVAQNYNEAFSWYQEAAKSGLDVAYLNLGAYYERGYAVQKDEKKAASLYQNGAEAGNMLCQNALGMCYKLGSGVQQDFKKAFEWFLTSAHAGLAAGQFNVALAYENGEGVEVDYAEALKWHQKAAEQNLSKAIYSIGSYYEQGLGGLEKDTEKAFEMWLKAAEIGDLGLAQFTVGNCYSVAAELMGMEENQYEALQWYLLAAENGYSTAQNNVAVAYQQGIYIDQDFDKAVYWYQKAVEQNDIAALDNFGMCYFNGDIVDRDLKKAVSLFTNAAEQGYPTSMSNLGKCYLEGWGVDANQNEALKWLVAASEQGDEVALEILSENFKQNASGNWIKKGGLFSSRKLEALPPAEKSYQATQGCRDLCKHMRADDDECDENDSQEMCYCAAIGLKIRMKTSCPIHESIFGDDFIASLLDE